MNDGMSAPRMRRLGLMRDGASKELIESGQIRRNTLVARVGASEWSSVKDVAVFDGHRRAEVGPECQAGCLSRSEPGSRIRLRYAGFGSAWPLISSTMSS